MVSTAVWTSVADKYSAKNKGQELPCLPWRLTFPSPNHSALMENYASTLLGKRSHNLCLITGQQWMAVSAFFVVEGELELTSYDSATWEGQQDGRTGDEDSCAEGSSTWDPCSWYVLRQTVERRRQGRQHLGSEIWVHYNIICQLCFLLWHGSKFVSYSYSGATMKLPLNIEIWNLVVLVIAQADQR